MKSSEPQFPLRAAFMLRLVVAALLLVEGITLWWAGATWILPHLALGVIVFGLVTAPLHRWLHTTTVIVAVSYAVLFVFPGSMLMVFGCGIVNSSCTNDEARAGLAGFGIATIANVTAAVLLIRKPVLPRASERA